jgi:hypothetical protein
VDLAFATHLWRKTVLHRGENGEERIHRRHFEVCVFSTLANELKSGDVAVAGAENYADYRDQLLPWNECEPLLADYCCQVGLPTNATEFVNGLHSRLSKTAALTDAGYLENGQVVIDENGIPVLKRIKAKDPTSSARALEKAILDRMRERSVIEALCDTAHWTGWTRHFGPLSGSDAKIDNPTARYIATTFTYGCNLGPAQARGISAGRSPRTCCRSSIAGTSTRTSSLPPAATSSTATPACSCRSSGAMGSRRLPTAQSTTSTIRTC